MSNVNGSSEKWRALSKVTLLVRRGTKSCQKQGLHYVSLEVWICIIFLAYCLAPGMKSITSNLFCIKRYWLCSEATALYKLFSSALWPESFLDKRTQKTPESPGYWHTDLWECTLWNTGADPWAGFRTCEILFLRPHLPSEKLRLECWSQKIPLTFKAAFSCSLPICQSKWVGSNDLPRLLCNSGLPHSCREDGTHVAGSGSEQVTTSCGTWLSMEGTTKPLMDSLFICFLSPSFTPFLPSLSSSLPPF